MLAAPRGALRYGGIVDLCSIFAVCTCRASLTFRALRTGVTLFALRSLCTLRATLTLNALRPLFTTRTSFALRADGTRSACGALRALLTLRADGAGVTLVTLLTFEVTACNAVLQLLQAVSGFLSALVCIARTGSSLLR